MNNTQILSELKSQSTWKLFGLTIITYGVYSAYYIKRQSAIINHNLVDLDPISEDFVDFFLVLSYVSLALFVAILPLEAESPLVLASNVVDLIWATMALIWSLGASSRMNSILGSEPSTSEWFSKIWTFFFGILYFNYKINILNEN
jgi:hypothetical protein